MIFNPRLAAMAIHPDTDLERCILAHKQRAGDALARLRSALGEILGLPVLFGLYNTGTIQGFRGLTCGLGLLSNY